MALFSSKRRTPSPLALYLDDQPLTPDRLGDEIHEFAIQMGTFHPATVFYIESAARRLLLSDCQSITKAAASLSNAVLYAKAYLMLYTGSSLSSAKEVVLDLNVLSRLLDHFKELEKRNRVASCVKADRTHGYLVFLSTKQVVR